MGREVYAKARNAQVVCIYQRGIDAGNGNSIFNMANILQDDAKGVPKDPRRAFSLYQTAIDAGNTDAMNNLAHMLHHGRGIQVDLYGAKHLYEQAIEKGTRQRLPTISDVFYKMLIM